MKNGTVKSSCKRIVRKVTQITSLHIIRLVYRSVLFIAATVLYILGRLKILSTAIGKSGIAVIWCVFIIEMILRFFPSKYESMGCQKQFRKNYLLRENSLVSYDSIEKSNRKPVFGIFASWVSLNGVLAVLYLTRIIDVGILILISLFYSVCDMICILFFCPFQSWMMKNRCCVNCRIYNWDYAMMFTPLLLVPSFTTWSLCAAAFALLVRWEITAHLHPEWFSEKANKSLNCSNCKEKLCRHKKQIQRVLATFLKAESDNRTKKHHENAKHS